MGGKGRKLPLALAGISDTRQEAVQGLGHGPDLRSSLVDQDGRYVVGPAASQHRRQTAQGRQAAAHAEPDQDGQQREYQRHRHDQPEDHVPHQRSRTLTLSPTRILTWRTGSSTA